MANYLASAGVQNFNINIGSGNTSNTLTINAVGSLAFIIYGGFFFSGANYTECSPRVTLTNSTTLTATRGVGASGASSTIYGSVIDAASSLVASVQFGTITIASGSASNTATITSVNTNNSTCIFLGQSNPNTNGNYGDNLCRVDVTGATTVTATRSLSPSSAITVSFCVVEFQSAVLAQAVQHVGVTIASASSSNTTTINSVTTGNSLTFYRGYSANANVGLSASTVRSALTNSTTLTSTKGTTGVDIVTGLSVVEFVSGILDSVQRNTTAMSSSTTGSTSITGIVVARSAVSFLGAASVSPAAQADGFAADFFNSTTSIGGIRGGSTGTTTASWDVAEIAPNTNSGSAIGVATVSGVGRAIVTSHGSATGIATVLASGSALRTSAGTVLGVATVSGVGEKKVSSIGNAEGRAIVIGKSQGGGGGGASAHSFRISLNFW